MADIKISKRLLLKMANEPQAIIEKFNLIYVHQGRLSIKRKKSPNGFIYLKKGKQLQSKKQLDRIKALVIPPAWEKVRITHLKNGHLQAVGRDARSRKQYRYHPLWTKLRNQTKFYKMAEFGGSLSQIRERTDQDLKMEGWPKDKVLALVINLMEETRIRIGNSYYAKNNKSYGLTTLRSKHVHLYRNKMYFEFVGKKGKQHKVTLRNKKLIKLIMQCEEIPGWELFQYFDENGEKRTIDSGMVNEYLFEITGRNFTAKDFRTWSGSLVFFEALRELELPTNEKEIKANLITAYDVTSKALGNTRSVCQKYYVHPCLPEAYINESLFDTQVKKEKNNHQGLSENEWVLLNLIKKYKVQV
ncbi:DNA topoisomerase IB [Mangrovimonas sp. ST2L15]|uniref:DNA topoisomerase IB n=1 Tax=Mangrovimonas sp. ST2L15 TaxID=1645916 RepID=UPI0006B6137A|nr:DNA topoisomerase IB [Mangrovimonas sp. ST2L15]